jgi:hypothetical protein
VVRALQPILHMMPSVLGSLAVVFLASSGRPADSPPATADLRQASARVTVPFLANDGAHPTNVRFYAETFAGTVFVTAEGAVGLAVPRKPGVEGRTGEALLVWQSWSGSRGATVRGVSLAATRVRLSTGSDPSRWGRDVRAFERVTLGEPYPGIDVQLLARGRNVEQHYTVQPGADPGTIRVRVEGARTALAADGTLRLRTAHGDVALTAPVAYQLDRGGRRPVTVGYRILEEGYGFALGPYDKSKTLIIDPLLHATYAGGMGAETVEVVLVHPNGDVYLAGGTTSTGFVSDSQAMTHTNAFIARFDRTLAELKFVQYMGGLGDESVAKVVLHPPSSPRAGEMVVAGTTTSPTWPSAGFGTRGENPVDLDDVFVGTFDETLQTDALRWISGSLHDEFSDLAIHPTTFDVYLAGSTGSVDFPAQGGFQEENAGLIDAFVARLSPDLQTLEGATYLGGATGGEVDVSITLVPEKGVYLKGRTNSSDDWCGASSPVAPPQAEYGGGSNDLFVARLHENLQGAEVVTYLGGNDLEDASGAPILVDEDTLDVYVGGRSTSDDTSGGVSWRPGAFVARYDFELASVEQVAVIPGLLTDLLWHPNGDLYLLGYGSSELPESAGSLQPEAGGGVSDAWVARVDRDLNVRRSTFLGGEGQDQPQAFAVSPTSGFVYVVGYTDSTLFPRVGGGAFPSALGFRDVFIARLSPDLSTVDGSQSTYYGGVGLDWPWAIAIDPQSDDVIVAGQTESYDLAGVAGGAQPELVREPEAFVARFDASLTGALVPDIEVTPAPLEFPDTIPDAEAELFLSVANVGGDGLVVSQIANLGGADYTVLTSGGSATCAPVPFRLDAGESCRISVTFVPRAEGEHPGSITVDSNDPDEPVVTVPLHGTCVSAGNGGSSDDGGGCAGTDGVAAVPLLLLALAFFCATAWRSWNPTP